MTILFIPLISKKFLHKMNLYSILLGLSVLPAAQVITGGPLETAYGRKLQERLERKERIT